MTLFFELADFGSVLQSAIEITKYNTICFFKFNQQESHQVSVDISTRIRGAYDVAGSNHVADTKPGCYGNRLN